MDLNDPSGGAQPGWVPPPAPVGGPAPSSAGWAGPPYAGWGAAPPGGWGPQPKRKRFGWGAVIVAFLVGGVLSAIVTVVGIVVLALTIGMPDAIAGTHPAVREGVATTKVGDCLKGDPGIVSVVDRNEVVDCDALHGSEVAAVIEVPGDDHRPSEDDLQAYTDDACALAFEGYVGSDPDSSQFGYAAVVPSDAAWADGDRTVWCLVDTTSLVAGEGTARHSRR